MRHVLQMVHYTPAKLASKRTPGTYQGLPIWLVTLQVHSQDCEEFDTVWKIRWPGQEAPELPKVMTHWSLHAASSSLQAICGSRVFNQQ